MTPLRTLQLPVVQGAVSLVVASLLFGLVWVFQPALHTRRRSSERRNYNYLEVKSSSKKGGTRAAAEEEKPFPSLDDAPSILLSLVVPAFDEEKRLPIMLDSTLEFMSQWKARKSDLTYEIVVVDDGSRDNTAAVVQDYSRQHGSDVIRLLKLPKNLGKGGALREGMLHVRGSYALMVDADGATDITCLEKLFERTKQVEVETSAGVMSVGIGSRAHMEEASVAKRAWYRTILMWGLHVLVSVLISRKIRDTQCGFKLFTRDAVRLLFGSLHLERWAFDLEIVYLADTMGLPMAEVQVKWHEVEGSKLIQTKLDVVKASVLMFRDMLCVRLCYLLGVWAPIAARPVPVSPGRAKHE